MVHFQLYLVSVYTVNSHNNRKAIRETSKNVQSSLIGGEKTGAIEDIHEKKKKELVQFHRHSSTSFTSSWFVSSFLWQLRVVVVGVVFAADNSPARKKERRKKKKSAAEKQKKS